MADTGPFEAFYASAWQQPFALWLAAAVGAAICLARRDLHASVRRYGLALALLSGLDAWLTASHVFGIGALPARLSRIVPLGFVLAGDFRYLLLLESARRDGVIAFAPLRLARAAGLTLIVPIFARFVTAWAAPSDPRVLFLVYELAFCALTVALLRHHPNAQAHAWVRALSRFVLLYYGLWAAADALLLATGADLGYALRVIPNLLYYGGLVAAIARLAPPPVAGTLLSRPFPPIA
jgi:hypothetical protein